MQGEPAFEEALFVHVEAVALIAYYNWSRSSQRYTIYYSQRLCSCYPRKEYDFLWVVCEVWVGLQKLITDLDRFYPYKGGVRVGFININDMYNNDVGKGGVYAYEAYEVK
jgi:hypothetical protein